MNSVSYSGFILDKDSNPIDIEYRVSHEDITGDKVMSELRSTESGYYSFDLRDADILGKDDKLVKDDIITVYRQVGKHSVELYRWIYDGSDTIVKNIEA